ncbi:MAG: hypothetical protein ACI8WT_005160 [Clostridium sp.]|jgi:hypothetical protein
MSKGYAEIEKTGVLKIINTGTIWVLLRWRRTKLGKL